MQKNPENKRGLTDLQMEIMRILWTCDEATSAEIHRRISQQRKIAVSTVGTILSRLVQRGAVEFRSQGRQYFYRAAVSEGQTRKSMVRNLVRKVFGGDSTELVSYLIREREIDPADLDRLRSEIDRIPEAPDPDERND